MIKGAIPASRAIEFASAQAAWSASARSFLHLFTTMIVRICIPGSSRPRSGLQICGFRFNLSRGAVRSLDPEEFEIFCEACCECSDSTSIHGAGG
jgi:hypothetical protein